MQASGVAQPWEHQARTIEHALRRESTVIATGTASGKSLAYLVPVLSTLLDGSEAPNGRGTTALYLTPTKALAADQRRSVSELAAPLGTGVRPASYDGDTPTEEREWVRLFANYVLTNPDMLHRALLPAHQRWSSFLRALRYVVIDECHTYRGVFGSHVSQVIRRLRRLCARYGSDPVFLLASATAAEPGAAATRLTGVPVTEITEDTSPRGELAFALWEPPLTELTGEQGAPVRRSATAEAAELLTDLALQSVRTVAFVRSRRGAELVSLIAQERLASATPGGAPHPPDAEQHDPHHPWDTTWNTTPRSSPSARDFPASASDLPTAPGERPGAGPSKPVQGGGTPDSSRAHAHAAPESSGAAGDNCPPPEPSSSSSDGVEAEPADDVKKAPGASATERSTPSGEQASNADSESSGGSWAARSPRARIAAYRGGYLPEERRALERQLHTGELLGLAATNALELGVDISGLDAVLITGYPGTRASLWQQAGRAGRMAPVEVGGSPAGQGTEGTTHTPTARGALAILIARDDPLDTYLVHHPEAVFQRPVEATVFDPHNPYVLAPHLCAAAAESPLTEADFPLFGPESEELIRRLEERKLLRQRGSSWYWTRKERATDLTDIRGGGGTPVQVVEADTGRLLGTVDAEAAHSSVHKGAVHLHQGHTYVVRELDLEESVALVEQASPPWSTMARETTTLSVLETETEVAWGEARLCFGSVEVTHQVVSYLRRRLVTGEVLGETKLDLPPRTLRTRAVWWTISEDQLETARVSQQMLGGALHAAEHAAIGMLPLFATCDRWDIGGVSIDLHPDTLLPTVFVYDGQAGGAGFAERAFHTAVEWLTATRDAIAACECESGCPSCVQSPKCGNGNDPLDKHAAVRILTELLRGAAS